MARTDPFHDAAARFARRLAPSSSQAAAWSPPTMVALKARIDAALAARDR